MHPKASDPQISHLLFSFPAQACTKRGLARGHTVDSCTFQVPTTASPRQLPPGYPGTRGTQTAAECALWWIAGRRPGRYGSQRGVGGARIWKSGAQSKRGDRSRFWRACPSSFKGYAVRKEPERVPPSMPAQGRDRQGFWGGEWSPPRFGVVS